MVQNKQWRRVYNNNLECDFYDSCAVDNHSIPTT